MDSHVVKMVEERCRTMSFRESTSKVSKLRTKLRAWPSPIVQARLEFDAVNGLDLNSLSPLQLMRVSQLKSELIDTLNTQENTELIDVHT